MYHHIKNKPAVTTQISMYRIFLIDLYAAWSKFTCKNYTQYSRPHYCLCSSLRQVTQSHIDSTILIFYLELDQNLVLVNNFTIVIFLANQNRKEFLIELEVKDRDRAVDVRHLHK